LPSKQMVLCGHGEIIHKVNWVLETLPIIHLPSKLDPLQIGRKSVVDNNNLPL